jgi:enamine deaminase RidA (YjgF/YER057c/UK114 family)
MRIYLTDLKNRPKFHEVRKRYFKGGVLPASTLLVVKSLASEELLVEVDADAVLD